MTMQDNDKEKLHQRKFLISRWKLIIRALVIIGVTFWVFWPTLKGDWIIDDNYYLPANPLIHDEARLFKIWFMPGIVNEYYPITESVQWLQWCLWGNNTFGYHLTNVILHATSAMLVWQLLSKFNLRWAWLGGLIFAIHPMQVESVAWISELKNTLSLPPYLLAICAWINYDKYRQKRDYWWALALFMVAMLCKISISPFPLIILLYAWWKRGCVKVIDLKASAPFWVIAIVLCTITTWAQFHHAHNLSLSSTIPTPIPTPNVVSRFIITNIAILFYLLKFMSPVGFLPIYPPWIVNPPALTHLLLSLVLIGGIYLLWTKRHGRCRHVLLGLGFFVISLAPVLVYFFLCYPIMFWSLDHLAYIPIIGLIGLLVSGLEQIKERFCESIILFWFTLAITLMIGFITIQSHSYAKKFINEETLWTYTIKHNPIAWQAYLFLGHKFVQEGRYADAIKNYEVALQFRPDVAGTYESLGIALADIGRTSEAVQEYKQALQIDPDDAKTHHDLGDCLFGMGRISEAENQYEAALRCDSTDTAAQLNLDHLKSLQKADALGK